MKDITFTAIATGGNMSIRQRSYSEVQKILEDYRLSGLRVPDYCSQHNLNAGTFHWWLSREKKKRDKQCGNSVSPFIRLDAGARSTALPEDFKQEMSIEIELRNGVRTRIQAALSLLQLSELLTVCGR
jgi:hypothetical protein